MYLGFYNNTKEFNNNQMFLQASASIGDNVAYPFVYLGQRLKELGHRFSTVDLENLEKFDAIVFIDFPGLQNKYLKKLVKKGFENMYLVMLESPIIIPDGYRKENHHNFKKIFTWDDTLVDNKKYFKINYAHKLPAVLDINPDTPKKLCTIISSNKSMAHPLELYSERIRAIRWFESNHPEDFDLYGVGWDRYNFQGELLGIKIARLNRLKFLTKLLAPNYPSYRGRVNSKKETYQKYQFSICYENARDIKGYITEKIFDCFFGGCVPIYLGAPNVTDHIPANTFIDKRNFKTYQELYDYIKNMPPQKYFNYLSAIKDFLQSKKAFAFSAECFANTIINEIT